MKPRDDTFLGNGQSAAGASEGRTPHAGDAQHGQRRLIILGLDGADLGLLVPWTRKGLLPAFRRVLREGAWGGLRSTMPPMTAPAWSTFMSGLAPARHGVLDFHHRLPFSYERQQPMVSGRDAPGSFWETCAAHGVRPVVMGVPVTYPPKPIDGVWISGLLTPRDAGDAIHPARLREPLTRRFGCYRPAAAWERFAPGMELAVLEDLHAVLTQRIAMFQFLLETEPWQLAISVFSTPDQVQHFYWCHMDGRHPRHRRDVESRLQNAILSIYQRLDRCLARMLDLYPDATFMVMSDHGAGPLLAGFHLNRWLAEHGYQREGPACAARPAGDLVERFAAAVTWTTVPDGLGLGPGELSIGLWPRHAIMAHADSRVEFPVPDTGEWYLHTAPAI
ncbi:alkaline phosphatase family protein, partial [bacterium]|nr:alkaline phosphatase family protein [candidate division CSSED10-310 bacterium]